MLNLNFIVNCSDKLNWPNKFSPKSIKYFLIFPNTHYPIPASDWVDIETMRFTKNPLIKRDGLPPTRTLYHVHSKNLQGFEELVGFIIKVELLIMTPRNFFLKNVGITVLKSLKESTTWNKVQIKDWLMQWISFRQQQLRCIFHHIYQKTRGSSIRYEDIVPFFIELFFKNM